MKLSGWSALACAALLMFAPGASGQAAQSTDAGAKTFADQAMMANVAEIKLGELAQKKAQNAAVKDFAQMMVRDHTKAKNELKQAAKGVNEPKQLDTKHQTLYDRLSKLSGAEFDREYMMAMVDGHREVKDMLEEHSKSGTKATGTTGSAANDAKLETAVNQWASKTLPAVEQHLQKAEQVSSQVTK